jgi:uncharacterized protein (TIGR02996 family)
VSEEADFVAAIRERPGDDARRLIFADWLEERGDRRAEYLRFAVEIASRCRQGQNADELVSRLRGLAQGIDEEWREAVGVRYDVVLESFLVEMKICTIRNLRMLTGLTLKPAKDAVESAPTVVRASVTRENAEVAKEVLEAQYWKSGPDGHTEIDRARDSRPCCRVVLRLAAA